MAKQDDRHVVTFRFQIHQEVMVDALGLKGRVFARCDRGADQDYRVIYWSGGQRRDEWLYDYELREV